MKPRKQFLCSECLAKIRKHDARRQQIRRLKSKKAKKQTTGKVAVKTSTVKV